MSYRLALGCCCQESTPYYYQSTALGPVTCQSKRPGTGTDGGGSNPWTSLGNITALDNAYTVCNLTTGSPITVNPLILTNFGFSIPANAQNIVVSQSGGITLNRPTASLNVGGGGKSVTTKARVTLDGSTETGATGTNTSFWIGPLSTIFNGTANDITFTPAQVNASTFGVFLRCNTTYSGSGQFIELDSMLLTVCYQLPL